MATVDTLNFIIQQMHIYFGISIIAIGVLGNLSNIIIFSTLKTFRETSCGFYLIVLSIVNMGEMVIPLMSRVFNEGFKINLARHSVVCKMQSFIIIWSLLMSLAILCSATIDQLISISKYRQYSNQRIARRIVLVLCLIVGLYSSIFPIFWDSPTGVCASTSPAVARYSTTFQYPVLFGFLPLTTITVFSSLAFYKSRTITSRNINIVRLSRDRQLTAMTLCHALFVVVTQLPFVIVFIYTTSQTNLDAEQTARNKLIYTITVLIEYSNFAVSSFRST